MKIFVALYETEIPQNLGAVIRNCACLASNISLIVIHPLSFPLDSKLVKRSKMDYNVDIIIVNSFDDFLNRYSNNRKILFTPHSSVSLKSFKIQNNDILFFGKESTGVSNLVASYMNLHYLIPMNKNCRSLNLSTSVAIVLYEVNCL